MLKSCRYCGRIHDAKYDCGRKPKRIRYASNTEAAEFRRKNSWTKASKKIRERDNWLCQICVRNRHMTQSVLTYDGISVHHIVPLLEAPNLALDPYNLITLCSFHHELAECGHIPREELKEIAKQQEERWSGA